MAPAKSCSKTCARSCKELLRRERKCESGSGVVPVARSAVPAGTRARMLLTYIRLVEGGRLQRDRRESSNRALPLPTS